MYFMVFAGMRHGDSLQWSGPVAVFEAESGEEACQAAARKVGIMGSYFAVEGFPWGVELLESAAKEFGSEDERVQSEVSRLERLERRSRELERSVGLDAAD